MSEPSIPLVGESEPFLSVVEQASRLAPLSRPVLVIGERGTGKELIAARLHYLSERWQQPFVKFSCAALNEELLESELFGHVAGAFTGATRSRLGRFALADGGTLFLDELASMSLRLQEKLLRVIEYGEFEPVGSSRTQQVDVRVVAAANVDLPSLARAGRFREDLLDRLSFDVITVPPLRARGDDVLLLAEHFARAMCRELGLEYFAGFAPEALETLRRWHWPGNVRELRNAVERAVYRNPDPAQPVARIEIDPFDSPWRPAPAPRPQEDGGEPAAPPTVALASTAAESGPALPIDLRAHLADRERALLARALAQARYNRRKAARLLGLSYDQLRGLLRKHGLPKPGMAPGTAGSGAAACRMAESAAEPIPVRKADP